MEIKKQYLRKYLHQMAIDQLADEYQEKGYSVGRNQKVGEYEADIVASNSKETIVIEVKSGRLSQDRRIAVTEIGNYIQKLEDYKFLVAVASPPKEKNIIIDNLSELIEAEMFREFPDALSELATHVYLEDVSDVEIDTLEIVEEAINVEGTGVVSVELQFGSDSDNRRDEGGRFPDSFPFQFEITLVFEEGELVVDEAEFKVDTSSYDE